MAEASLQAVLSALLLLGMLTASCAARADQEPDAPTVPQEAPPPGSGVGGPAHDPRGLGADIKAYLTSPLRWEARDWLYVGGAFAAIGLAHHFDDTVRRRYAPATTSPAAQSYELQDIAPTAVLFVGTWGFARLTDDQAGRQEGWAMLEAATFSAAAGYAMKLAAGRERPTQTANPDLWRHGGSSFPSLHSTVAFAVGTVLAESGHNSDSNEEYRWLRRLLGYGVGVLTSYERIRHNQHWLSDTVAGAALGAATAHFALRRREGDDGRTGHLMVIPADGGAMLSYRRTF